MVQGPVWGEMGREWDGLGFPALGFGAGAGFASREGGSGLVKSPVWGRMGYVGKLGGNGKEGLGLPGPLHNGGRADLFHSEACMGSGVQGGWSINSPALGWGGGVGVGREGADGMGGGRNALHQGRDYVSQETSTGVLGGLGGIIQWVGVARRTFRIRLPSAPFRQGMGMDGGAVGPMHQV